MTTQQLANATDFGNYGLMQAAFAALSPAQQNAELLAASCDFIDAVSERYTPPYSSWGENVTRAVCVIASWNMLSVRGYDPTAPADVAVKNRFDFYMLAKTGWLARVNAGEITLQNLVDSTGGDLDDQALGGAGSDTGRFADSSIDPTVVP